MSGHAATLDPPARSDRSGLPVRPGHGQPPQDPPEFFDGDGGDHSGDDQPEQHDWVTLAVFWSITEAHLARLKLEDHDVPCVLLDELTCGTGCLAIAAGGVKLQVPRALLWDAALLLQKLGGDIEVARFTSEQTAKMAACVVEAAKLQCTVLPREDGYAVDVAPAVAALAGRALRGTRFSPAVQPWVEGRPEFCACDHHAPPEGLPAPAYRRWLALRVWQWIDRHLPAALRPLRCLACGGPRRATSAQAA